MMDERVMRRENECGRVVVEGRLADGGGRCTLVVVHYRCPRCWIVYPHGVGKLGVIINEQDATTLAQGIAQSVPTSGPVVRWARCPHNGRHHAVRPLDADRMPALGYAETLCGHTIRGEGLTFQDTSSGALCVACVVGVTSDLPDPGQTGTAR